VSKPFETLQRQRGSLLGAAGLLLLFMSTTLVLIIAFEDGGRLDLAKHWPSLTGLLGMVLVFVLYVQHKHQQLAAIERQLHELAVREATSQARFHELSSLFETSTQLQLRLDLPSMLDSGGAAAAALLGRPSGHDRAPQEGTGLLEIATAAYSLLPDAVAPADEGSSVTFHHRRRHADGRDDGGAASWTSPAGDAHDRQHLRSDAAAARSG
jgi:hypothetical protein